MEVRGETRDEGKEKIGNEKEKREGCGFVDVTLANIYFNTI